MVVTTITLLLMPRAHEPDQWSALDPWIGDGITRPIGPKTWVPDKDARRLAAYSFLAALRDNAGRYFLPTQADPQADAAALRRFREYGDPRLLVVQARAAVLGDEQTISVEGEESGSGPLSTWLNNWATRERLWKRLTETEFDCCGLGDGVYALGWDARARRPRLRMYDPGWYFPDLDQLDDGGEYPTVVHIAWEQKDRAGTAWLHRKTWRIVPTAARRLPWQEPEEPSSDRTCLYSSGRWDLSKLRGKDVFDLSLQNVVWDQDPDGNPQQDVDLGVDFIPVVHVPADAAGRRHFGTSVLTPVVQLAWDVAATDTDLQVGSELFGSSAMVTKGTGLGADINGDPESRRWEVPASGSVELLDTSKTLVAMTGYDRHLLERMSENARMPAAYLGRIRPDEVPSGITLELGFAPMTVFVRESRQVRDEKLPLILKFSARLAQVGGVYPAGTLPAARVVMGSYLPRDLAAAVDRVTKLLAARAISLETAVQMLIDAGLPIEDAKAEVKRIVTTNYDAAVRLLDATGDEQAVRDLLHKGKPDLSGPPPEPPAGMPATTTTPPGQLAAGGDDQPRPGADDDEEPIA